MGRLSPGHIIETVVWLALALLLFVFSFEFNQDIEIYKFGATGWPRVIILLLVLAAVGNLYYHYRNGEHLQENRIGVTVDDETANAERSIGSVLRILTILISPFVFAFLLKPVGFYAAAPVFIVLTTMLMGERSPLRIVSMTLLIYLLLLLFFMVLLNANLPQGTVSPFYDISAQILKWNTQLKELF